MNYADLLGMTGGNQQSAGIMNNALGGGNVGAQLLGASPAQLPGAGFQGFAPTSTVPDLLAKYRAQAAVAPSAPSYQPAVPTPTPTAVRAQAQTQAPAAAPTPAQVLNYNPINPTPEGPKRLPNGALDVPPVIQMSSGYQFDPTGSMGFTNTLGQLIYPYGNNPMDWGGG